MDSASLSGTLPASDGLPCPALHRRAMILGTRLGPSFRRARRVAAWRSLNPWDWYQKVAARALMESVSAVDLPQAMSVYAFRRRSNIAWAVMPLRLPAEKYREMSDTLARLPIDLEHVLGSALFATAWVRACSWTAQGSSTIQIETTKMPLMWECVIGYKRGVLVSRRQERGPGVRVSAIDLGRDPDSVLYAE